MGGGGIASAGRTSGAEGAASAQGFRGETPPSVAAGLPGLSIRETTRAPVSPPS